MIDDDDEYQDYLINIDLIFVQLSKQKYYLLNKRKNIRKLVYELYSID